MHKTKDNAGGNLVIISVIGQDSVGIIAEVSAVLQGANINILDINQTILQGFFTMVLVADLAASTVNLTTLKSQLNNVGKELGVRIDAQRQDVFKYMHRI